MIAIRADMDAQAEILLAIRPVGGDVIPGAEPQSGKPDFAGRTAALAAQPANAEKSRTASRPPAAGSSWSATAARALAGFLGPGPPGPGRGGPASQDA